MPRRPRLLNRGVQGCERFDNMISCCCSTARVYDTILFGPSTSILTCIIIEYTVETREMVRDEASVTISSAIGEGSNKVQHKIPNRIIR